MSSISLERFQSRVKSQVKSRILQGQKSARGIKNPIIIHVVKIKIALEGIQITIKEIEAVIATTTIAAITIVTIRTVTITTVTITTVTIPVTIQTTDVVLIVQIGTVMKIESVQ